jgi:endonuclease YncB( thermonuclease family)
VCYIGGENINDRLREGWALDYRKYSTDYLQRKRKPCQGAGVWRGEFVPPWQWRS